MSRKIVEIIAVIILIFLIILGTVYVIDLDRMRKNEEVLFSTWGRDYTVRPEENTMNTNTLQNEPLSNQNENLYFFGKVIESTLKYIIVEPNENETIRKTADKIEIFLGERNDATYGVGTNVKVIYKGYVMETYPAKVDVVDIELKSVENFEIRFYDKQPNNNEKVHKIIDKSETDKYNYNIYAYDGNVNILINKEEISLRDALLQNKITMDEIIVKANEDLDAKVIKGDMYRDGGSIIYKYDGYTIIKCHRLDGNRDVYIGTRDMTINDVL